ncbi:MAG: dienelactone hydrolase family protein [Candidatus Eremiobacteraeota bacterium]|nr:dienelactone hydrolase family protein [Candidatus Eremiobacteraeota bacterium]MCW5867311.1 dienelactone hydrolase family protein [Candidatus Eremiobacteraeota bacterium]
MRVYEVGDGPRGLIVLQEIFGLNSHIRAVCDGFARDGFRVVSPALFDRVERGVELGYGPEDLKRGSELAARVGYFEAPMLDVRACLELFPADMPVSLVGYCWGGTLAWLSAQQLPRLKACVGYYGGRITSLLDKPPLVPVMLHFGKYDKHIDIEGTRVIRQVYPQVQVFEYEAGHGFNCDQRADYEAASAALARRRTLELIEAHAAPPHHGRDAQA